MNTHPSTSAKIDKQHQDLVAKVFAAFKEPFKAEALNNIPRKDKDGKTVFLTGIKAYYIVERLNDVLGMDGWEHIGEYQKVNDKDILFHGKLIIRLGERYHVKSATGHASLEGGLTNLGDVYKAAKTDALSKASSLLGIGSDIYKGKVANPGKKDTENFQETNNKSSGSFKDSIGKNKGYGGFGD